MIGNSTEPIITSTRNVNNVFNHYLKFGILCVMCGIFFIYFGDLFARETNFFSSDFERLMPIFFIIFGGIGVLTGVTLPFLMKSQAKMFQMSVYKKCIIGRAMVSSQGSLNGQILNFEERAENISSVSTDKRNVIINLRDGRKILCPADNAEEIAIIIRNICLH